MILFEQYVKHLQFMLHTFIILQRINFLPRARNVTGLNMRDIHCFNASSNVTDSAPRSV